MLEQPQLCNSGNTQWGGPTSMGWPKFNLNFNWATLTHRTIYMCIKPFNKVAQPESESYLDLHDALRQHCSRK